MEKINNIFYPSDLDQSNLEIIVTMVTKGTLKFKNFKVHIEVRFSFIFFFFLYIYYYLFLLLKAALYLLLVISEFRPFPRILYLCSVLYEYILTSSLFLY
jgi:hypothetical protein